MSRREQIGLGFLLDAIEMFARRFVVVDEAQATAVALWMAHTWAIEAARATPYLFVCSAEPESGKTRLLEVFQELVREPISTMNISDAALFRTIATREPTLLFDEVDAIFNPKARARGHRDDLRALLNAGYRRGQLVFRMGGGNNTTLESFRVFGAKALAGLGDLPPTLQSRCLRIEIKRRRLDEPVEDFFPDEVATEAERLRNQLGTWAAIDLETLRMIRPTRIDGLRDRTNEVWRPLLAIAELAGEAWTARARRAALGLAPQADEDASLGVLLLGDIRTVFDRQEAERIATSDLVRALGDFEESPWREWWVDEKTSQPTQSAARRLAQLLRPYGVRSQTVRVDEKTAKGYKLEDFADVWERFLPGSPTGVTSVTSVTSLSRSQAVVTDVTDVTHRREPVEAGEWLHATAPGDGSKAIRPCFPPRSSTHASRLRVNVQPSDRLLTAREVADMLGVSTGALLRWTRAGKVPALKLPSGAVRYRPDAIQSWLDEREMAGDATRGVSATRSAAHRAEAYDPDSNVTGSHISDSVVLCDLSATPLRGVAARTQED